jgi:hypothetical protein
MEKITRDEREDVRDADDWGGRATIEGSIDMEMKC